MQKSTCVIYYNLFLNCSLSFLEALNWMINIHDYQVGLDEAAFSNKLAGPLAATSCLNNFSSDSVVSLSLVEIATTAIIKICRQWRI